jgi:hypothetical protein
MRFVFFGFGDSTRAVEIIDEQIQRYQKELARRKKNLARWEKSGIHVRLIAELGANLNEMVLEWLKHSREEILKEAEMEHKPRRAAV